MPSASQNMYCRPSTTATTLDLPQEQIQELLPATQAIFHPDPEDNEMSSPPKSKRFKTISSDFIDQLAGSSTSKTTNYQTMWSIKMLRGNILHTYTCTDHLFNVK